ncbi:MAG: hypothetical protein ACFWTY_06660 [Shouchella clausii]
MCVGSLVLKGFTTGESRNVDVEKGEGLSPNGMCSINIELLKKAGESDWPKR